MPYPTVTEEVWGAGDKLPISTVRELAEVAEVSLRLLR